MMRLPVRALTRSWRARSRWPAASSPKTPSWRERAPGRPTASPLLCRERGISSRAAGVDAGIGAGL
jgi:hypothetical protein